MKKGKVIFLGLLLAPILSFHYSAQVKDAQRFCESLIPKIEAEYAKFLIEVYSEEELTAIVNFGKSSVGQSIIKKEPVILGKIMVMMQARIQSVLPEIQKMTRDFSESVKKIK